MILTSKSTEFLRWAEEKEKNIPQNINELLDTTSYNRLRFGIGSNFTKKSQSDYVLSKWSENESSELSKLIPIVNEVICMFVLSGIDLTMSQYNS